MTDFSFDWKVIWAEIKKILNREGRSDAVSSEAYLADFLTRLVEFLHASRMYVRKDDAGILAAANELLVDTRNSSCIEGVLLLVNCLPTSFSQYDELLPSWIKKWFVVLFLLE